MHPTTLRRLEDLFAHRGDAHVLLALKGSAPLRFGELAQLVHERSTERVPDNTIARALSRLEHDGHISCDESDPRHPTYQLRQRGDQPAGLIAMLVHVLEAHDQR